MEVQKYISTHQVEPGTRIMVETKSHKGYALATVKEEFEVAEQSNELEPHKKELGIKFFLAMTAFSVSGYSRHPSTVGHYPVGTSLYAFKKKGGGLAGLTPLPRKK